MKKILSIDDEPQVLKCIQSALERRGYELLVTNDPEEGLKILKDDDTINLLLLDIMMPGKDGFELYREIRQFKKIPVLFVTAHPKSFNAEFDSIAKMWEKEFTDGTTDMIYKPFDL
ncbi:response regulator, partial [Verrucomicrobiota bacterium]